MPGFYVGTSPLQAAYIGTTPIKEIYVGTTKVRPTGWQPGADTILYMPFKTDLLDHSGNNISFTNTNVTLSDNTAYFNGSANLINSSFTTYLNSKPFTCSIWVKTSSNTNDAGIIGAHKKISGSWGGWDIQTINNSGYKYRFEAIGGGSIYQTSAYSTGTWYLLTGVVTGSRTEWYVNGVYQGKVNGGVSTFRSEFAIGQQRGDSSSSAWRYFTGYMSDLIIESKARTAQEISDYFNLTKSNYGL